MQKAYINALYELAQKHPEVISVLSDSGTDYDEMFAREFPGQCVNFGISEQHMIAAAAGMASCGKVPFVYTTGAFLAYRALEFIRNDVCLQDKKVIITGMGSGLAWSTLGPTHHALEDISALRALPNLIILSPASPLEVKKAVNAAYESQKPVYIRIGMKGEQEIYEDDYNFKVGENIELRKGTDVAIFATGSIISEVLDAAALLEEKNISTRVINVHTLKPFQNKSVLDAARDTQYLFSVEEHNVMGGLGSIIAETLSERREHAVLRRIGVYDKFAEGYGTLQEVRKKNGVDSTSIARIVEECVGRRV